MKLFPRIQSATPKARFELGGHFAVLLGDIVPATKVQYAYILVLCGNDEKPIYYVTSEVNTMAPTGGGSHFLCVFDEPGRLNYGASDDWADEELFTTRAMDLIYRRLGNAPPSPKEES